MIDLVRSSNVASSKYVRGWENPGSIRSIGRSFVSSAAAAAAPSAESSAESPRPNGFRVMGNYLLGQLKIRFCSLGMRVVESDGFSIAGRFGEPNIPGNRRLEDLLSVKIAQVRSDCGRQVGSLVVHRQQQPFDR